MGSGTPSPRPSHPSGWSAEEYHGAESSLESKEIKGEKGGFQVHDQGQACEA